MLVYQTPWNNVGPGPTAFAMSSSSRPLASCSLTVVMSYQGKPETPPRNGWRQAQKRAVTPALSVTAWLCFVFMSSPLSTHRSFCVDEVTLPRRFGLACRPTTRWRWGAFIGATRWSATTPTSLRRFPRLESILRTLNRSMNPARSSCRDITSTPSRRQADTRPRRQSMGRNGGTRGTCCKICGLHHGICTSSWWSGWASR